MFKNERLDAILKYLSEKKIVKIKELQDELFISTSTLRRDLIELEKTKKITKNHGVVEIVKGKNVEYSYLFRESEHSHDKKYIAELASVFLGNNQSIFLDASTTTSFLVPYFHNTKNNIVLTNGIKTALELHVHDNVTTLVAGGRVASGSNSILGDEATSFINNFHADISFISCRGLSVEGLFEANYSQASVKKYIIKNSDFVVLMCDDTKFNQPQFAKLAFFNEIDVIITNKKPSDEMLKIFEKNDIEVLY